MADQFVRSARFSQIAESSAAASLLFAFFTIAGALYIVVSKYQGVSQILVTLGPVAIMGAYATLLMFAVRLRLRDDQAGDNLYYMGFLFTLTSLAVTLYNFSAQQGADEIVKNFGIAIASTVAGIAARILFSMARQDPIEVERVARVELAQATKRVRRELDNTVLELSHFRRSVQQMVSDGISETGHQVQTASAASIAAISSIGERTTQPLEAVGQQSQQAIISVTKNMVEALEDAHNHLVRQNSALASGAEKLAETVVELGSRLSAMQSPEQVIEIKLAPVISKLTSAVNKFEKTASANSEALSSTLAELNARIGSIGTANDDHAVRLLSREEANTALIEDLSKAQIVRGDRQDNILRSMVEVIKTRLPVPSSDRDKA